MEWITMSKVGTHIPHSGKLHKVDDSRTGRWHYEISQLVSDSTVQISLDAPLMVNGVIKVASIESQKSIHARLLKTEGDILIRDGDLYVANEINAGGGIDVGGYISARIINAKGSIRAEIGIRAASVSPFSPYAGKKKE